jgi:hypothetical protein
MHRLIMACFIMCPVLGQLDEQEHLLDVLKQEVTKTSGQLTNARGELSARTGSVSFESPAAPQAPR